MEFERPHIALIGVSLVILYAITLTVYRFFLHPLAHVPGPPLAILTYLYEWYYDVIKQGSFTFELRRLHEKYGPIIRINPDEVHIFDEEFTDKVFNQSNGRADKPRNIAEVFGPYPAAIGTAGHDLHRLRRAAVNPFFSKAAVVELTPAIIRPLEILCGRLMEACKTGQVLNMRYFYAAITLDVMNGYCFAREPVTVLKEDFGRKEFEDIDDFMAMSFVNLHMPWLVRPTFSLPDNIYKMLVPKLANTLDYRMDLSKQVEAIRQGEDESYKDVTYRTVIHELFNNSKLPSKELEKDRVRDEVFSLVTAGSGTTELVLRATAYHISANPTIRQRLYHELKEAMPDPNKILPLPQLEKLPYLSAIVQEGLRVGDPITHRVGRQFPQKTLVHPSGISIPAGTTVHVTLFFNHQSSKIFPNPYSFKPERWLEGNSKALEKYLTPFNRGTRACLGQNLARAELYIILATIFRRFDFDVSRVERKRDIDFTRNSITGVTALDSPGILVTVKEAMD